MKSIFIAGGAFAVLLALGAGQASADQSGLAGMHDQYVVKGRRCFTGHTHVGTGSPIRSKKSAVASAAQDWSSFTAFEYGSSWASWRLAIGKQVSCEAGNGKWTCEVQARPCLGISRKRRRHARR